MKERMEAKLMMKIKKIAKYAGIGVLALALIAIVTNAILSCSANKELEQELADIKASGGALKFEELAPPAIPDEENAAPLYEKAFALLKSDKLSPEEEKVWNKITASERGKEWAETDRSILKGLLARNQNVLELLAKAAALKKCRFSVDYSKPLDIVPPSIAQNRQASWLLAVKAQLESSEGKTDEALNTCLAGFRMTKAHILSPLLITQLVQSASTGIILDTLEGILKQDSGNAAMYTALLDELKIPEYHNAFIRSMEGERCFGLYVYELCSEGIDPETYPPATRALGKRLVSKTFIFKKDQVYYLRLMKKIINLSKLSYKETKGGLNFEVDVIKEIPSYCYLTRLMVPGLSGVYRTQSGFEARLGAARLALALKAYKLQNGNYPDALAALAPAVIPELPKDTFTGNDYVYKKDGVGFIVYSLGENLKDDGGLNNNNKDKKQDDISWQCKQ
ncbi:MAG: hypothetical protein V1701_01325 [Planctomycetota bacterium]